MTKNLVTTTIGIAYRNYVLLDFYSIDNLCRRKEEQIESPLECRPSTDPELSEKVYTPTFTSLANVWCLRRFAHDLGDDKSYSRLRSCVSAGRDSTAKWSSRQTTRYSSSTILNRWDASVDGDLNISSRAGYLPSLGHVNGGVLDRDFLFRVPQLHLSFPYG